MLTVARTRVERVRTAIHLSSSSLNAAISTPLPRRMTQRGITPIRLAGPTSLRLRLPSPSCRRAVGTDMRLDRFMATSLAALIVFWRLVVITMNDVWAIARNRWIDSSYWLAEDPLLGLERVIARIL